MDYHYIITVTTPIGSNGYKTNTVAGITRVTSDDTRSGVFARLYELVTGSALECGDANVQFFSLEPESLLVAED